VSGKSIALVVLGFIVIGILNATSFCYLKGRHLSNGELFEAAISHEARDIGDYSSIDTPASYLERHPNCCSIPVFQPTKSLLNFLLGCEIRYVRVVYRRPQAAIDKSPQAGDFYEAFVEVTPCGTTLHRIGTTQIGPD
jgi:hypothetical protein